MQLGKITKAELERVAGEYGYSKMEDLHAALGYGKFSARQVLAKIAPGVVKEEVPRAPARRPFPIAPRRIPRPAPGAPTAMASSRCAAWTT